MTNDPAAPAASGPGGVTPPGPYQSVPSAERSPRPSTGGPVTLPDDLVEAAGTLFGDRLPLAAAYAELLATEGVVRGLIGPREAPRIWDRHLLNCAAVAELIPTGARVVDVGSGAGLPGLVLAVARPDLSVVLVEPLARRTAFLDEAVDRLGLDGTVTVQRGRAEEFADADFSPADVVTARAVAPLDRLAGWCLPLAAVGGRLVALKGNSAPDEVAEHRDAVDRLGGGAPVVRHCGVGLVDPPTTVVEIVREREIVSARSRSARRTAARPGSGANAGRKRARRG